MPKSKRADWNTASCVKDSDLLALSINLIDFIEQNNKILDNIIIISIITLYINFVSCDGTADTKGVLQYVL